MLNSKSTTFTVIYNHYGKIILYIN